METKINDLIRQILLLEGMFISLFFGFTDAVNAQDWTFVQTPISTSGGAMNSMYFLDKNTGWIVGSSNQGDIIHTTNGGTEWIVQTTPVSGYLSGVFFVNADIGYAVGSEGFFGSVTAIILKTTNGGQEWLRQTSPVTKASFSDVHFVSATKGWAIGTDSGANQALIVQTSNGTTWEKSSHPVPQASFNAITFVDPNHGWIVGNTSSYPYQPIILSTNNGGQTWIEQTHPLTEGNLDDVFFVNPDSGWAVGRSSAGAVVLKTTNGGITWTPITAPPGNGASCVFFLSSLEGYLAVNCWSPLSTTLYKTTNGGDTWIQLASTVPDQYPDKLQVVRGSVNIFVLFSQIFGKLKELELSKISIDPNNAHMQLGGQITFTAQGYDASGVSVQITPLWTTSSGTVTSGGLYTATVVGDFIVTASVQGSTVTGTANVHVTPNQLSRIEVTPGNVTLQIGGTQLFTAFGYDSSNNQVPITPIWTTSGGTITSGGLYTATVVGDFIVTASVQGSSVTEDASVHVLALGQKRTIYVDDDGPADFNTIQVAINAAFSGDTVVVAAGTYKESVAMKDGVNLQGSGRNVTIIDARTTSAVVTGANNCRLDGFTITGYIHEDIDGVYCEDVNNFTISHNIIKDNTWSGIRTVRSSVIVRNNLIFNNRVAGVFADGQSSLELLILNNTISGNQNEADVSLWRGARALLVNNIIGDIDCLDNTQDAATLFYNNIFAQLVNGNNISIDPLFADPNNGDYHLKSQAGRWDLITKSWIKDDMTSPCIDAGDPMSPIGLEPFPNGGMINMGAYGGTAEASKSYFGEPVCETIMAGDINGDCKVDWQDLAIMASHWLQDAK